MLTYGSPIGRKALPKIGTGKEARDGLPLLEDGRVPEVESVIWCTGYRPNHDWIDLPVLDERLRT